MPRSTRVLIVDDSALVRQILTAGLQADPNIEVVGAAADPYQARDMIVRRKPDVMTLDVEMPRMDGVEFLRKLMPQYPLPVLMVSSLTQKGKQTTLDCLEAGAVDFVSKPSSHMAHGLNSMLGELRTKVKLAGTIDVSHWKSKRTALRRQRPVTDVRALAESTDKVIAIGASTGGTEAIKKILGQFSATMPGVVIVQHMPPGFTRLFADRLNQLCDMEVKEAATGDRIMPGRVLIAPGALHMRVVRKGGFYHVTCESGENVNGHCPSVNVLMESVARHVGPNAVGVMLTGMGADGAAGMLSMRQAGARNIAQDEASSIVFGMPREAFKNGGAERLVPLEDIAPAVVGLLSERKS